MQCNEIRDYVADYLKERLTPSDQAELSRHLRECPSCNAELEEFTDLWVKLGALPADEICEPASAVVSVRFHRVLEEYKADYKQQGLHGRTDPQQGKPWRFMAAAALALVVLVVLISIPVIRRPAGPVVPDAVIEAGDGSHYRTLGGQTDSLKAGQTIERGEIVRAEGGAGAMLVLADGSRVEMRAQSELSLERADDGVRIRLSRGGVIINAAKQRTGHLYVQTKDVIVSVVGTVFLVNAEEAGSRVAVIQGEVHVQEGAKSKKLLPGEQVATNPLMESHPVSEEISWSRNAEAHLALLQQSASPAAAARGNAPAPSRVEFEVVSLKPIAPTGGGFINLSVACRGVDGIFASNGPVGPNAPPVPQGRCIGSNVIPAALIGAAYSGARLSYGPDWPQAQSGAVLVRGGIPVFPDLPPGMSGAYQIEAKAEDPSTATTEQLRQMLQSLMADRFKLKVHRETKEVQGYLLLVGKDGTVKFKETSGDEENSPSRPRVPGMPELSIRGKFRMKRLANALSTFVGTLPVLDETELPGIYDISLTLHPVLQDPTTGGRGQGGNRMEFDPSLFKALEEQLGLRLESAKVPVEYLVIDQIEKPSEN